ncbi:MAG: hypothetical protein KGI38_12865 [Thaumarchaeota archaeon]|nr:hypothetical protein [Nitrososphaerota archaeon]
MTKRQVEKLMISRQGKAWNTEPERNFDLYQKSRGLNLIMNRSLPFVAENREGVNQRYDFQCDFLRPTDESFDIDFEVDGRGHKEKNDPWKDAVKNRSGLKVIHIDGELTKKKWWDELDRAISRAILSKEPTVRIVA